MQSLEMIVLTNKRAVLLAKHSLPPRLSLPQFSRAAAAALWERFRSYKTRVAADVIDYDLPSGDSTTAA